MRFDCIVIIHFTVWVFFSCSRSAGLDEDLWNPQVRAEHVIYHISTNDPCNQLQTNSKATPTWRSANDKTLVTSASQRPTPDEMCQMGLTSLKNLHWTEREQDCSHAFSAACRPYGKGKACTVLVRKKLVCSYDSTYRFSDCTKSIVKRHEKFLASEKANEDKERKGKYVASTSAASSSGGASPPVSNCDCRFCVRCTLRECPGCQFREKKPKPFPQELQPQLNRLVALHRDRVPGTRNHGLPFPLQPSAPVRYQTNRGGGAYGASNTSTARGGRPQIRSK